jgi:hypothetical protein
MELSPLQVIGGLVSTAVGGGGVTAFFNWLGTRDKAQAYAKGLVDRAMENALAGISDQLKRADERLALVEKHRDECDEELERGRLERAGLQAQIARLMAGPVANYGDRAPT